MEWLQAILLGILQGISEPLPISSSAHLLVVPWLLGWPEQAADLKLTFDLALHLGTTLALVTCFRREIFRILQAFLRPRRLPDDARQRRLGLLVVFGCIPAGLLGILFDDLIEKQFRAPLYTALPLGVFGLLLYWADHAGRKTRSVSEIRPLDALLIGSAQALALVPGVSRSGVTITAGLSLGFRREEAAAFSFLMMTPLTAGACLLKFKDAAARVRSGAWPDFWSHDFPLMAVGTLASFLAGVLCVRLFLRMLKRFPLDYFVIYRLALSVVIVAAAWLRVQP